MNQIQGNIILIQSTKTYCPLNKFALLFILEVIMNGFDLLHDSQEASEIEAQLVRKGIALGINWNDEAQVQDLAREALHHSQEDLAQFSHHHDDYKLKAKIELFGLAALMMQIMSNSADEGIHTHGGAVWKSFSRALMHESGEDVNPISKTIT
jgi:hypothetical protein